MTGYNADPPAADSLPAGATIGQIATSTISGMDNPEAVMLC
ncbi:hypothetical protein [Chlorobium phaeobacteroides]|nr:hypothetical protein [Chlorobium phaeobacteroides]